MSERTTTSARPFLGARRELLPCGPGAPRWVQGLLFASDPMGVLRRARVSYGSVFTLRLPTVPTFVVVCDPQVAIAMMFEPPTPRGDRDRTALPLRRLRTRRVVARHVLPAGTNVLLPLTTTWDLPNQ